MLPAAVLADYDRYCLAIDQNKRLNRYPLIYEFFNWWCVYYLSSINGTQNTEMEEKTKIGVLLILKVVKSLV